MLNLLFISDSPKAEHIKNELQPLLKVIIDVVTDFDRGMKDVFEKRPATVCIQDHIGGVSGESVARHIQMLLGNAAPTFILFHTGNAKARVINGLFEHLVDLSLSHDVLFENLLSTLKQLRGKHWENVTIPRGSSAVSPGSLTDLELSRNVSGKPVDDFATGLEALSIPSGEDSIPLTLDQVIAAKKMSPAARPEPAQISENSDGLTMPVLAPPTNDEMVEMLLAEVKKAEHTDAENGAEKHITSVIAGSPEPNATPPGTSPSNIPTDNAPGKQALKSGSATITPPPALPAEKFRISQNAPPDEEPLPEELLLAFEENYRSKSLFIRRSYIIALACVVSLGGGWYFLTQKPQLVQTVTQQILPSSGALQKAAKETAVIPPQPPAPLPKPLPAAAPALPSFIPKEGLDSTYARNKPGWNRYIGTQYEFRVFTGDGRIQAVQVLSANSTIPDSFITSVLQEFAGTPEYQILSRTTKDGVRVENGKIKNTGDIIFYRKNGSVKAFVVSVN